MSEFTKKTSHPCWAEFECYYKINDTCTYWEKVKAMLSRLQEEQHKGASCCLGLIDIFQEPCFELDEDGRKCGIGNGFGYKE